MISADMNSNNIPPKNRRSSGTNVDELLESLGTLNVEIDHNGKLAECLNEYEAKGNAKKLLSSLSDADFDLNLSYLDEEFLQSFKDGLQDQLEKESEMGFTNAADSWAHDNDWIPDSIVDTDEPFSAIAPNAYNEAPSHEYRPQNVTSYEAALLHPDKVFPVSPSPQPYYHKNVPVSPRQLSCDPPSFEEFTTTAGSLAQKMAQTEQSRRYIDRFLRKTQRRSSLGKELRKSRMQVRQLIHDDLEYTKQQLLEQMEATAKFVPRRRHSLTLTLKNNVMMNKPDSYRGEDSDAFKQEEEDFEEPTRVTPSPQISSSGEGAPLSPQSLAIARKGGRRRRFSCTG